MKRKGYQIGIALAATLFVTGIPVWAGEVPQETETLCGVCQVPMLEGLCTNTASHGEGGGIVFDEPAVATDPDSMASAYEIENVGQLVWFVTGLDAGTLSTSNAFLADDIDWTTASMAGVKWEPIGSYVENVEDVPYNGVFNGNGYVISGLTFSDMDNGNPMTVFGNIGSSGIVKELGLEDVTVTSDASMVSVLAWKNQGQIKDCYINDTTITAKTESALVSDIAAVNNGTIKNSYAAVTVIPGMKADSSGTVTLSIHPIYGENWNSSNPDAISNNYYLQTEDPDISWMIASYPDGSGVEGELYNEFASGCIAWKLNKDSSIFGQTLADYAQFPAFVRDESYTDSSTGTWVEKIVNKPVHQVTLDYTDEAAQDLYYYVNDTFWYSSIPVDTAWQMTDMYGTTTDVTGDISVDSDIVFTQKSTACPHDVTAPGDVVSQPDCFTMTDGTRNIVCSACGEVVGTEPIPAAHQYGEYVIQEPANCISAGTMVASCIVCHSPSEPIPNPAGPNPDGHQFENCIPNNDANCVSSGTMTGTCVFCQTQSATIPNPDPNAKNPEAHQFENCIPNNDATCVSAGTMTGTCVFCQTQSATIPNPDTTLINPNGHQFENCVPNNDANCISAGTMTGTCVFCQTQSTTIPNPDPNAINPEAHNYQNCVPNNDANCVSGGTMTGTCSVCQTQSTTIPNPDPNAINPDGHKFENYVSNNDANCISAGTVTGTCVFCQMQSTAIPNPDPSAINPDGHKFENCVSNNDANCVSSGTMTGICAYCQTQSGTIPNPDTTAINPDGHKFENCVPNNDATCISGGTMTGTCVYCQTQSSTIPNPDTTAINPDGHQFENCVPNNDANCISAGTMTGICALCQTQSSTIPNPDPNAINPDGHQFENCVPNHDANCISAGTMTGTCSICQTQSATIPNPDTSLINPDGHKFENCVPNNDATCNSSGTMTGTCVYCQTQSATIPNPDPNAINPDAHKFENCVSNNDATCVSGGTMTGTCAYCQTQSTTIPNTDSNAINPDAHSFTVYQSKEEATCQNNATEIAVCDHGCGAADTREISGTKTDHSFGEYIYNNNAGCLKNGTETATCIYNCGESIEREAQGTIIPHKFDQYVHNDDATCQVSGTETAICAYGCETTDTRTITDTSKVVPHKFETYTYNNDESCQKNGTETATCVYHCGTTDTREVADTRKPHTFANGVCTACGASDDTWIADDVQAIIDSQTWYGRSITLTAPEGCFINTKNTEDFGTATTVTIDLKDGANTIVYYLRRGNGKIAERRMQLNADHNAPTGNVSVGSAVSSKPVSEVTFEMYFGTAQIVRMQAQDGQSGLKSIEYLIADQAMNEEALKNAAWTVWSDAAPLNLTNEGRYVIYVKLTDNLGNTSVINTDGFILDMTAPKIEGAANGSSVCPDTKVTITDVNAMNITLNGRVVALEEGKLILTQSGAQTLKAVDRAGNQSAITFNVKDDHTWDEGQIQEEATCMKAGVKLYTCTTCRVTKTEEIPMVEHRFSYYGYNQDATCEKDGTKSAFCEYGCNTFDMIPAIGTKVPHQFTNYVYNQDATCQKDGTKTAFCEYGCNTVDTVIAEGTKTGHKFTNYVYNQDGSCRGNGTKTAVCEYGCNTVDTVTAEGTMTGHKFTNYVYNRDASCRVDGTKTAACDYGCGTKDTITAEGTKLAHTYGADHICVICKTPEPETQPTVEPTNPDVPILGIEDFGGMWGIVLISAGAAMLLIVGIIFAVGRKRR